MKNLSVLTLLVLLSIIVFGNGFIIAGAQTQQSLPDLMIINVVAHNMPPSMYSVEQPRYEVTVKNVGTADAVLQSGAVYSSKFCINALGSLDGVHFETNLGTGCPSNTAVLAPDKTAIFPEIKIQYEGAWVELKKIKLTLDAYSGSVKESNECNNSMIIDLNTGTQVIGSEDDFFCIESKDASNDVVSSSPIIRNVVIKDISIDSAMIQWETDVDTTGELAIGLGETILSYTNQANLLFSVSQKKHAAPLMGLKPGTTYFYQISVKNFAGNSTKTEVLSFTTSQEVKTNLKTNGGQAIDPTLTNRLKGSILLAVESNGEAWYVDPKTGKRFYLKDGTAAFSALKKFGTGITNVNLDQIPVGFEDRFRDSDSDNDGLSDKLEEALGTNPDNSDSDGDSHPDGHEVKNGYRPNGAGKYPASNLCKQLEGKIMLQVESRGQAWYIRNCKRYYLKDGEASYQIMRFLSLGIKNSDLQKITVGEM